MTSSGLLRRVALVRTDVSEEPSTSIIRVTRIGELGTTLAVTSNWCTHAVHVISCDLRNIVRRIAVVGYFGENPDTKFYACSGYSQSQKNVFCPQCKCELAVVASHIKIPFLNAAVPVHILSRLAISPPDLLLSCKITRTSYCVRGHPRGCSFPDTYSFVVLCVRCRFGEELKVLWKMCMMELKFHFCALSFSCYSNIFQ
jgi:hypothetical protein